MVAIVIQCAARKHGASFRTLQDIPIRFVARPEIRPAGDSSCFAHPDAPSDRAGTSWRGVVAEYHAEFMRSGADPFGLSPAWALYADPAYAALVRRFAVSHLYILSAGWGLLRAAYLTPDFDITFSPQGDPISIRGRRQEFHDHRQLPADVDGPVIFVGGAAYVPHFLRLTADVRATRRAFFNSGAAPSAAGCQFIRYETDRRTNWHYSCAEDLSAGRLDQYLQD